MKKWMHKAEKLIDDFIPPLLLVFLLFLAAEVFLAQEIVPIRGVIDLFDTGFIILLAADLYFKYQRIRNVPRFLKKYWLQIIAVLPFFLAFRVLEYLELSEFASRGSVFVNETRFIARGPALIIREAQEVGGLSRTARLLQFRPLARLPRLLSAIPFFEKPTGRHHLHEKKGRKKR